jgi:hypothetical protein
MLIDWFALLTPMVALPIAALFVCLGCTLETQGQDCPYWFTYDPHCDMWGSWVVNTIDVVFQPVLESGEAPSNLRQTITLHHPDIKPGGDTLTQYGLIPIPDEGDVQCSCVISAATDGATDTLETNTASVHKVKDEQVVGWFELSPDPVHGFVVTHT